MRWLEYQIGWRYIRSAKRRFVSAVSTISILGIAVGVMVIITVLSVMNGFRDEIRDKMLDVFSHNTVFSFDTSITQWQDLKQKMEGNDDIIAVAPFVESQLVLMHQKRVRGVNLRGVDPDLEPAVSAIDQRMLAGTLERLQAGSYHMILGESLANALRVEIGDSVTALSPQTLSTPAGIIPKMRRFEVVGIFKTGLSHFDRGVALANLSDVNKLLRLPARSVSGLRLRIQDLYQAPAMTNHLQMALGPDYIVSDWTRSNQSFFRALEMEKLLLLIIMMLIVVVAMFNIVSMLVMVVMDKRNDIAILQTIGMLPSQVMRIFIAQGCVIGLLGNGLGVISGIVLATHVEELIQSIEKLTGFKFLSPEVYPITEVPSQLLASDVAIVATLTFTLSVLATLYPAWRAGRIRPAEVLKST